jgi:hypothetical protein
LAPRSVWLREQELLGERSRRKRSRQPLRAVHDDDLEEVLADLGLLRKFAEGHLRCFFCGTTVGWENLHALFPLSGDVKASCTRPECVQSLLIGTGPSGQYA